MTIFTGKHLIHDQFGEKCYIVSLLFSFYLIKRPGLAEAQTLLST